MYKFLVHLLDPYSIALLVLVATTGWECWRQRSRLLVASTVLAALVALLSTPLAGYLALGSLEWTYPPSTGVPRPADTIVVLSAGLIEAGDSEYKARLDAASIARCYHAALLYKKCGSCRVILSGGKVDWSGQQPTYAVVMREFMLEMGVRANDIVLEEKSTSTYENALYSRPFLENVGDSQVWLVTEAAHMNRSERCFRAQGISVIPVPCDYHAWQHTLSSTSFIPSSRGISQVCRAAHEWRGRVWYRLLGRI